MTGFGERAGVRANLMTFGGLAVMIGSLVVFSVLRPGAFPTIANAQGILDSVVVLLILGAGVTVVLSIGEFDLSFASTVGLAGAVCVLGVVNLGWPVWFGVVAATATGAMVGVINGLSVAYGRAPAFIVTLAVGSFVLGIERFVSGDQVVYGLPDNLTGMAQNETLGVANGVWIALLVTVGVWVLMRYSVYGRRIAAIGSNRRAADLAGLAVAKSRLIAFVLMGAIAGLAGAVLMAKAAQYYPNSAAGLLLAPYAAAFLGAAVIGRGKFGAWGTFVGVLYIGILQNGITMLGQPVWIVQVVQGVVLAAAVLLARQFR
jgi:ribose transport system permease protein